MLLDSLCGDVTAFPVRVRTDPSPDRAVTRIPGLPCGARNRIGGLKQVRDFGSRQLRRSTFDISVVISTPGLSVVAEARSGAIEVIKSVPHIAREASAIAQNLV